MNAEIETEKCHVDSRGLRLSEQQSRSLGAILGLSLGILLSKLLGFSGPVALAGLGAGGCVAGAIAAERMYAWIHGSDR
jgi:hypothetical protein